MRPCRDCQERLDGCLESSSSREPSAQLKSSASNTRSKACHKALAKVITMNVSGGNSKEIFELFTNKLVFSVSVPCAKYCWPAPTKDFSSQLFTSLY